MKSKVELFRKWVLELRDVGTDSKRHSRQMRVFRALVCAMGYIEDPWCLWEDENVK